MKTRKKIKRYQEFLMNSWPAHHYYFLNGWILRFNDGVTSRTNSVFPLRYTGSQKTLDEDIKIVEQAYGAYNLPPIFTMHEFHEPKNLKAKLIKRGYHTFDFTNALGIRIHEIKKTNITNDFKYEFYDTRINEFSDFLARFSGRNEKEQLIIDEIANRMIIPKKLFIVARSQGEIVGSLMAVLVPQGFLYLGDVLVHPNYRRQKLATSLFTKLMTEWAVPNGAKYVWLQVEIENSGALNLYSNLGLKNIYSYYYMKRDL